MKGLVEVIAKALVDDPAPVEVHELGDAAEPVFRLKVGKDDLGKVIGKKGRTAKAFRTLLAAAAAKQNRKITLEILEPERLRRASAAAGDPPADAAAEGADGDAFMGTPAADGLRADASPAADERE